MPMFSPLSTHLFGSKGIKEMPEKMRLEKEREFTGFYVSGHPMNEYEAVFKNPHIKNFYPINQTLPTHVEDALEEDDLIEDHALSGEMIRIAGVVQEVEVRTTRNHQQMANIVIEDTTATIKAIIFPITFSQHIQRIRNGEVLAFYGKVEVSEFGTQFIVNGIETMDELMTPDDVESMTLYLNANLAEARMEFEEVMGIFKERPLENKVSVSIVMDGKTYSKRGGSLILGNTKLSTIVKLQTLLGRQSVSVHYDK
jgi:DNA polymerase-3 subunit alpha